MADVETFEQVGSGASATFPQQCSSIRKGGFAVLKARPCRVVETSTSKTGKHGHAKVHMVGIDIFTGKKYEEICPSTHNMDVPNVKRADYQVVDISDDSFLSLLNADGSTKDDLKVPEGEIGERIKALFDDGKDVYVTVVAAMGEEQVQALKDNTSNK